jgi:hypothetical protein
MTSPTKPLSGTTGMFRLSSDFPQISVCPQISRLRADDE